MGERVDLYDEWKKREKDNDFFNLVYKLENPCCKFSCISKEIMIPRLIHLVGMILSIGILIYVISNHFGHKKQINIIVIWLAIDCVMIFLSWGYAYFKEIKRLQDLIQGFYQAIELQ